MKVLEDLTEEEAYLYAILTDHSGIDQAEFTIHDPEHEDECFRCWPFQWEWYRCNDTYQTDCSARCLKEDTLILTQRGWIEIQNILVGDLVLTHKNRWRKVTNVFDRGIKEAVTLSGYGREQFLTMTPDHRLWAAKSRRASMPKDGHKGFVLDDPEWISPDSWQFSDGSQIGNTHWSSPAEVPSFDFIDRLDKAYVSGRQNYVENLLNVDFMWLYGLYLAEGSCYQDSNFSNFCLALHDSEIDYVSNVLDRLGLNYCVHNKVDSNGSSIQIHSKPLVDWIKHVGKGSSNKEMGKWIFGLDKHLREAVLDGYIYGDGYTRNNRSEITTTSFKLALDTKILANSLGYHSSINLGKEKGECEFPGGRIYNTKKSYIVSIFKGISSKPRTRFMDGKAWSGVDSIIDHDPCQMWDLEVEEDNSFVANCVVCHNSIGKSLSIELRAYAFPFIFSGKSSEMVITAPEGNHLNAITGRIETLLTSNRLTNEMLGTDSRSRITHKPFVVNFRNGSTVMGRIPGHDGKRIKGIHPIWLEMDESQDYPDRGWKEIIETLKSAEPGACWRAHGVTRGIRDYFYKISQPNSGWTVHRYHAVHRPTWTDKERDKKIEDYDSRDDPDFRRNVYGFHGDATNPIFVLSRLMKCVDIADGSDDQPVSEFNENYFNIKITHEMINDADIISFLDFPIVKGVYWIGADIGFTNDPTEILIFKEENPGLKSKLVLVGRIKLMRVNAFHQAQVFLHLMQTLNPVRFSMDKTGNGLPLLHFLQQWAEEDPSVERKLEIMQGFNFSEKILFDIDDSVDVNLITEDIVKEAGIFRQVLECSTDVLRSLVDQRRIWMPHDKEVIKEFSGQTYTIDKSNMDMYGRNRRFSKGSFHTLDAARMAALGWQQYYFKAEFDKKYKKPEASTTVVFI